MDVVQEKCCAVFTRHVIKLLPFIFSVFCQDGFAGGNATYGVAPRAQSMQTFTAVADDASAVFSNPAGLTQFNGTHIEAGGFAILPELSYRNYLTSSSTHSHKLIVGPDFFVSTDMAGPVRLGIGMYAPFSRHPVYTVNSAIYNLPLNLHVLRVDVAPTIAADLNPMVSVGASLVMGRVMMKCNGPAPSIQNFSEHGTGVGVTGQAGVLAKLSSKVKLGVDYRGPMSARVKGKGTMDGVGSDHFVSHVRFPGVLSTAIAWQAYPSLLFSVGYEYEMWSYLHRVTRQYSNSTLNAAGTTPIDGKNVGSIRLGTLYRSDNSRNEYRAGYSYLPAAVPTRHHTPIIADFNTHLLSAGYSRYYKNWRLDAGYEHAFGFNRTGTNVAFPGKYKMWVNTMMLGVGYSIG